MEIIRIKAKISDKPFIYQLKKEALYIYVDTIWGWDEVSQKKRFEGTLQLGHIDIIVNDYKRIGIVEIAETEDRMELVNLEIVEEMRNQGIGTKLIPII